MLVVKVLMKELATRGEGASQRFRELEVMTLNWDMAHCISLSLRNHKIIDACSAMGGAI